jgi:signal transduction histidine kinase
MQVSSKGMIFLITITTVIFLIAPIFLILYVSVYNKKKAKHLEEKKILKETFELDLLKSQIEIQERIMQTISTTLHDNIGQLLSLTSMTLSAIKPGHIQEDKIQTAGELTVRAIQELRQLSKMMNGQELTKKNLGHAIAYELEWVKKGTEFEILFTDNTTHSIPENADKELILFRLFQEILGNIIKHAQATVIRIEIQQTPESLSLMVKDNGIGFIVEDKLKDGGGMGLANIATRAKMMNGKYTINSIPDTGTEISVAIPYL